MSKFLSRRKRRSQRGAGVAEYAAVTAAGLGIGYLLFSMVTGEFGKSIVTDLLKLGFSAFF